MYIWPIYLSFGCSLLCGTMTSIQLLFADTKDALDAVRRTDFILYFVFWLHKYRFVFVFLVFQFTVFFPSVLWFVLSDSNKCKFTSFDFRVSTSQSVNIETRNQQRALMNFWCQNNVNINWIISFTVETATKEQTNAQHTDISVSMREWEICILTVLPFKSFTRQCKYTLFPKCVVTLTLLLGSSKYGNGSCVVVSSPSSISFSSGVSVNGDENSCQKFFGNESNGSPSRGFTTAKKMEEY